MGGLETNLLAKKRMLFLLTCFSIIAGALLLRCAWIQIVKGSDYQKKALAQQTHSIEISPNRGNIYDKNGKFMAISASVEMVFINPQDVRDSCKESLERYAKELADIVGGDKDLITKQFRKRSAYEIIKRRIEINVGDAVRQWIIDNNINGVSVVEDSKRYYPNGNLASNILGFVGTDNQGLNGIEITMEKYLKGYPGRIINGFDAKSREFPFSEEILVEPKNGNNITLTIDENIQYFAEKAIDKAITDNEVENGATAIVMDPRNGDILAMVSKPDYDSNKPFDAPDGIDKETWAEMSKEEKGKALNKAWRNKAISDLYEPGSTFKAITSSAGLEEGVIKPDSIVNDFPVTVLGKRLNCWRTYKLHGVETFAEGVYNSCNPVFVRVAQSLGISKFYSYVRAFGFYDKTGIQLPGEAKPLFHKNPTELDMAVFSFGQRSNITPIQLITAYAAIANGGNLMKPRIIKEITDTEGNIVEKCEPEVIRRVISEKTSETLRKILEGVVSEGTGANAYISGYRVAGKTGTSETIVKNKYIASFSSFAPADNPEICVLVTLDNPTSDFGHMGGVIAAPVAKEILKDTLDYLHIKKRYTEKEKEEAKKLENVLVPDIRGKTVADAKKIFVQVGLNYKVLGDKSNLEAVVKEQTPKPGVNILNSSAVIFYTYKPQNQEKIEMPNILNEPVTKAIESLRKAGLNIEVSGNGVAVDQQIEPGTMVAKGKVVKVEFRSLNTE